MTDTSNVRNRMARRTPGAQVAVPEEAPTAPHAHAFLEKLRPQIAKALPQTSGFTPDRFARVVLTEFRRTPKLWECSRDSLMGGVLMSAQLGLEIGGPLGHSYLVPFKDTRNGTTEATWILGYKGMIQLAYRSGQLASIEARDVRAHDEFRYSYGLHEELHHIPAEGDRGPLSHVYAIARYTNGGHYWVVLSKAEVNAHRARSKAKDNGPWVTDYEAMARKTAIRVAAPFLPLSAEIARAIASDDSSLSLDGDDVIDVPAHEPPVEVLAGPAPAEADDLERPFTEEG